MPRENNGGHAYLHDRLPKGKVVLVCCERTEKGIELLDARRHQLVPDRLEVAPTRVQRVVAQHAVRGDPNYAADDLIRPMRRRGLPSVAAGSRFELSGRRAGRRRRRGSDAERRQASPAAIGSAPRDFRPCFRSQLRGLLAGTAGLRGFWRSQLKPIRMPAASTSAPPSMTLAIADTAACPCSGTG